MLIKNRHLKSEAKIDSIENIKILRSALKHGLSEEDILYAYDTYYEYAIVKKSGNVNCTIECLIGMLPNENTCELMATASYDEKSIVIFHAKQPPSKDFMKHFRKR